MDGWKDFYNIRWKSNRKIKHSPMSVMDQLDKTDLVKENTVSAAEFMEIWEKIDTKGKTNISGSRIFRPRCFHQY